MWRFMAKSLQGIKVICIFIYWNGFVKTISGLNWEDFSTEYSRCRRDACWQIPSEYKNKSGRNWWYLECFPISLLNKLLLIHFILSSSRKQCHFRQFKPHIYVYIDRAKIHKIHKYIYIIYIFSPEIGQWNHKKLQNLGNETCFQLILPVDCQVSVFPCVTQLMVVHLSCAHWLPKVATTR